MHSRHENGDQQDIQPADAPGEFCPVQIEPLSILASEEATIVTPDNARDKPTARVSRFIEARAPLPKVYDAWTRFRAFPHFMKGVDVRGWLNESRMVWRIRTGAGHVPLDAEVYEQIPCERIAWRSIPGHPHPNSGEVNFDPVDAHLTRISVHFDFGLPGTNEWPGDPLPAATQCLDWSLESFRSVTEAHVAHDHEDSACFGMASD